MRRSLERRIRDTSTVYYLVKRTIIVGDVHGCIEEAEIIVKACGFEPGESVVFVGDLVGRGPDSKGVLELARRIEAQSVRGNHEQAWLLWRNDIANGRPPQKLSRIQTNAVMELDAADWNYLAAMPFYIKLPEYNVIVVHAGLAPGIDIEVQNPEYLLNIRTIGSDGLPSTRSDSGVPWGSMWRGPQEVVFGHNASRGLQRYPFATGLDTGCVYGGCLTAYLLPERRLVSVPAARAYKRVSRSGS